LADEDEDVWEDFTIERPHLIVCEGAADKNFLERLLAINNLADTFQVTTPTPKGGGVTKFPPFLAALPINRHFPKLLSLTLVTDNDTAERNPFHRLQQLVRRAREIDTAAHYPVPERPLEPATKAGYPAVFGVLLPWHDRRGNLETLILEAFSERWRDARTRADEYVEGMGGGVWEGDRRAISLLQCMIAVLCEQSPNCSLTYIWSRREFRDLLEHSAFNHIVEFFRGLPALL
jgi:hypothetical protein